MKTSMVGVREDAARRAWRATGRLEVDFVAGCRAQPFSGWNWSLASINALMTLWVINRSPLLVLVGLTGLTASTGAWVAVGRKRRQRAAAEMVIPFPTDWRGAPTAGLLAVGTTEVVVWAKPRFRRGHGEPVAAMPRDRIYDTTFEDGHRLMGGGWIHVVGVDGERMILGVRPRDVAAGRRVTYALSRQAVSPRW